MASSRLPGKPLADIGGVPMIVQVWRRGVEAGLGRVVVAAAEREIALAVRAAGGEAVETNPDLPSGSDRIFEALSLVDPEGRHDAIVNLQGDLPLIAPDVIRASLDALTADPLADIATLVAEIKDGREADDPNVVKAVASFPQGPEKPGFALYFTRARAPTGAGPLYHHIGLYAYRRAALARFVGLPPSPLELRERLEQLRALEAGMRIAVARVDAVPYGVDTPADLARARADMAARDKR
jgi:3-deoxy-manno-octulosonate cytidylyltransferase (CMP-KDO synthetase)